MGICKKKKKNKLLLMIVRFANNSNFVKHLPLGLVGKWVGRQIVDR